MSGLSSAAVHRSAQATGLDASELRRLLALLAIPSVSVDANFAADVERAAQHCVREIERAGGVAQLVATDGPPLVRGEVAASSGADRAPRVLVYGHYDVQAPGSLEAWETAPFEPTIRDGYLFARGANDDKGQLFLLLAAVQRLAARGDLPVNVSFLIDGEEEIGGASAPAHVTAGGDELAAAIVFDAPMLGPGRAALYVACRGLVSLRVTVRSGTADGHSGRYGGGAANAAHVLMGALQAVLPKDGRLPEPLTRGVAPLADWERESWRLLPEGAALLGAAGLVPAGPRAAAEFHERTLAAPAVDVHMLAAGGPQPKSVVLTEASATLSARLAPGQRADEFAEAMRGLIGAAVAPDCAVAIDVLAAADAAQLDPSHPVIRTAAEVIETATGLAVQRARLGGTLPVLAALAGRGVPTILTGFHQADDRTHSANERIALAALGQGLRAATALLSALGDARTW
jgi:acetylornithine deacetylase/succinyl-diaminopimelate desuccinylase-like protein